MGVFSVIQGHDSTRHNLFQEKILSCEWRFQGFISAKDEQPSQKHPVVLIKSLGPSLRKLPVFHQEISNLGAQNNVL